MADSPVTQNPYGGFGNLDVSSGNNPWNVQGFLPSNFFNSSEAINADKRTFEMEKQAQSFNSAEAQKQRDYEERLSNTAVQRSAADWKAAGFSPLAMLGSGSPASTPSGSAAHSSSGTSRGGSSDVAGTKLLSGVLSVIGGLITHGMSSAAKVAASASSAAISGALSHSSRGVPMDKRVLDAYSALGRSIRKKSDEGSSAMVNKLWEAFFGSGGK